MFAVYHCNLRSFPILIKRCINLPRFQKNQFKISLIHYQNLALCLVLCALLSIFCRALDKAVFVGCHTRQSPTLGNDHVYREQDSRHMETLDKDNFVDCQTLGEERRSAKSRQQPSIANNRYLCRVSHV
jgi:hypothetical protein